MPFARLTLHPAQTPDTTSRLAADLTSAIAKDLGKRHELTSLLIETPASARWTIGAEDREVTAHLEVCVTAGTNSEEEKRIFVPYDSIPKIVINSFLSAEDKNFFNHPGVDAKGILRAIIKNISNIISSKRLEGASTITQQVAKNFLLTNEVSINRKIKEAILAFRIERALTKERILELYLNQIYLGEGSYGIASASLEYFDKPISKLNYKEASLLAALPKAPSKYNPFKNAELAKYRRNLVINNLLQNSYIDKKNIMN